MTCMYPVSCCMWSQVCALIMLTCQTAYESEDDLAEMPCQMIRESTTLSWCPRYPYWQDFAHQGIHLHLLLQRVSVCLMKGTYTHQFNMYVRGVCVYTVCDTHLTMYIGGVCYKSYTCACICACVHMCHIYYMTQCAYLDMPVLY